jgi:hypothetical protein
VAKKPRLSIHKGLEILDDAQRAEAEAMAKKGWPDDDDIVVDPEFDTRRPALRSRRAAPGQRLTWLP